jgi:hypothetical protein
VAEEKKLRHKRRVLLNVQAYNRKTLLKDYVTIYSAPKTNGF